MNNRKNFSIEDLLEQVHHCPNWRQIVKDVKQRQAYSDYKCPLSAVLVIETILDLYSVGSTDQANILRITTNLEAAADDLLRTSTLIKRLAEQRDPSVTVSE